MDPTEKRFDEYLTQLNQRIEDTHTNLSESLNYSSGTLHSTYGAVPGVTVGSGITASNSVWTNGVGTSIGTPVWTTTTGGTGYSYTVATPNTQPGLHVAQSGRIHIQGDNADIVLGDKSMRAWIEKVEERLNILTPNPELEKEWDDLRKLGERYRKLEKKCQEKAAMWKKLKSMPASNVK